MEKIDTAAGTPAGKPKSGLLLSFLSALLAVVVPAACVVVPGLWAYTMRRTKPAFLALFAALYGVCVWFWYGGDMISVVFFTGLYAFPALLIWLGQVKRIGNAYTVLAASGAATVMLYLLVCLPGLMSGEGAFSTVQTAVDESTALIKEMLSSMPSVPKELAAYYDEQLEMVRGYVQMLIVPIQCAVAGVIGLSNLLFFRLFARGQALGLAPLRPFRLWEIPRSMTTGMFVMLVGALVLLLVDWEYAVEFNATVNVIVGMPLTLQGLCVIDFLIVRSGKKITTRRVLIFVLAAITLFFTKTPFVLLGCMEQLFQIRARAVQGPQVPPNFPKL